MGQFRRGEIAAETPEMDHGARGVGIGAGGRQAVRSPLSHNNPALRVHFPFPLEPDPRTGSTTTTTTAHRGQRHVGSQNAAAAC